MIVADAVIRTAQSPGHVEVVTVLPALRTGYVIQVSRFSIRLKQACDAQLARSRWGAYVKFSTMEAEATRGT